MFREKSLITSVTSKAVKGLKKKKNYKLSQTSPRRTSNTNSPCWDRNSFKGEMENI